MKKMFTKLFSTALITAVTLVGFTAKAQTTSLNGDAAKAATTATATTTDMKAETKSRSKKRNCY